MIPVHTPLQQALRNVESGIIEEPRALFDQFRLEDLDPFTVTSLLGSHPDAFLNGEAFPLRITHLTAAIRPQQSTTLATAHDFSIQAFGLRIQEHDSSYITRLPSSLPLWHNVRQAGPDPINRSTSVWKFERPFVLGLGHSLHILLQAENAPVGAATVERQVGVSITGIGARSMRPYFFSDFVTMSDLRTANHPQLDASLFRNNGEEPIIVTSMTTTVGADDLPLNADPAGDIRWARMQIKQVGGGTNANWFRGPHVVDQDLRLELSNSCPASLLGPTVSRAITHKFPGDGYLLEPGEQLTMQLQNLSTGVGGFGNVSNYIVVVGLLGYISVS